MSPALRVAEQDQPTTATKIKLIFQGPYRLNSSKIPSSSSQSEDEGRENALT
jgi:hypothetical protein